MSNSVIIKSFKHGISVILDNECSFNELKSMVQEKFEQSQSFSAVPTWRSYLRAEDCL